MLAALLTPPGRGAIAVIHVCGEGARALVTGLFGKEITGQPRAGKLTLQGEIVDEVMVRTVRGFTGEETIEITCHGGTATVDRVFGALGVPRVEEGALLERGVETGHLDRCCAEAWALLPHALTELAARVLHDQAEGALSRAVGAMSAPRDAERLLATAPLGFALARPRQVVLAGSPNVGKSTLFNALVAANRAIVSPEPGTTRDPVREQVAIDQVPLELVDTAGVEEPRDLIEQLSIERTRKMLEEADVILFLFDAEAGAKGDELRFLEGLAGRQVILLVNKIDIGRKKPLLEALPISARTGQGLEEVRRRILHAMNLRPEYREGAPVVFTDRQHRLLVEAARGHRLMEVARQALLETPAVPPV